VGQLATLVLAIAVLAPSAVAARPQGSAECRYLESQISFFESRIERAKELRNELWEARLTEHLDGLEKRQAELCPGYSDSEQAMQALQRLIELAAQGALTFFTLGAF
jgi:hypothetical protein